MDPASCNGMNGESEFPQIGGSCYLDHAGATLAGKTQIESHMKLVQNTLFLNPHSVNKEIENEGNSFILSARKRVLSFLNAPEEEYSVIFTSGATAAIKLVGEWFQYGENGKLYYLQDNHTSVLGVRQYALEKGATVRCLDEAALLNDFGYTDRDVKVHTSCGLFIYPLQSNFSGRKYGLEIAKQVKSGMLAAVNGAGCDWFVMADGASIVSTSPLSLNGTAIDFLPISFYKIFGYPTGLGALVAKRSAICKLRKVYFGGGTVEAAGVDEFFHFPKADSAQWFEDGTLPYQQILAVNSGFDAIENTAGGMESVSIHTYNLAKLAHDTLQSLRHTNNSPVVEIYCDTEFRDRRLQGPILSFNLLRNDGAFIGYSEVQRMAKLYDIHIRTGCFCNIGACQKFLGLSTEKLKENHRLGHKCGDSVDLVNGQPTGAIRVSFGYMSNAKDVETLVHFIKEVFVRHHDRDKQPLTKDTVKKAVQLKSIRVYPVKSCAPFIVEKWELSSTGLLYDRMWSVVSSNGTCLTLSRTPDLIKIKPSIDLEKSSLVLNAEGFPSISLPLQYAQTENQVKLCDVNVCGNRVSAEDCGDEASRWVSDVLCATSCRLVKYFPVHSTTKEELCSRDDITLTNDCQYLLISESSVNELCEFIRNDMNHDAVEEDICDRFRANIIATGPDPYEENTWESINIAGNIFQCVGACERCAMVCVDKDGAKEKEPLRSLTKLQGSKPVFGIKLRNASVIKSSYIQIGDIIHIS